MTTAPFDPHANVLDDPAAQAALDRHWFKCRLRYIREMAEGKQPELVSLGLGPVIGRVNFDHQAGVITDARTGEVIWSKTADAPVTLPEDS